MYVRKSFSGDFSEIDMQLYIAEGMPWFGILD